MSDTPRTDAEADVWRDAGRELVNASFARELERELKQWRDCAERVDAKMLAEQKDHNVTVDRLMIMRKRLEDIERPLKLVIDERPLDNPEHSLTCALKLDRSTHVPIHRDTLFAAARLITELRAAIKGYQCGLATGLVAISESEYARLLEDRERLDWMNTQTNYMPWYSETHKDIRAAIDSAKNPTP